MVQTNAKYRCNMAEIDHFNTQLHGTNLEGVWAEVKFEVKIS